MAPPNDHQAITLQSIQMILKGSDRGENVDDMCKAYNITPETAKMALRWLGTHGKYSEYLTSFPI